MKRFVGFLIYEMVESSPQHWQTVLFCAAGVLILWQTFRGWRLGGVRMVASVLAIIGAYVSAWIAGPQVGPLLRPLSLPDPILAMIGGGIIGLCVFLVISGVSALLFKKTSDHSIAFVRFGFGVSGAAVGLVFGLVLVWAATVGVRLAGTVAEKSLEARQTTYPVATAQADGQAASNSGSEATMFVRGMAQMKQALEQGPAGPVMQQMDPVPGSLYQVLGKVGAMAGSDHTLQRFMTFPGVKPLAEHPKMLALRDDPQVARDVLAGNYLDLLKNPRVLQVANDAEIMGLLQKLEFEKALDYALGRAENAPIRHRD